MGVPMLANGKFSDKLSLKLRHRCRKHCRRAKEAHVYRRFAKFDDGKIIWLAWYEIRAQCKEVEYISIA
jgi:hypothetical protein